MVKEVWKFQCAKILETQISNKLKNVHLFRDTSAHTNISWFHSPVIPKLLPGYVININLVIFTYEVLTKMTRLCLRYEGIPIEENNTSWFIKKMMVLILSFIFHAQAQHITQLEFLQKLRTFKIQIQQWNFKMC